MISSTAAARLSERRSEAANTASASRCMVRRATAIHWVVLGAMAFDAKLRGMVFGATVFGAILFGATRGAAEGLPPALLSVISSILRVCTRERHCPAVPGRGAG